MQHGDTDGGGPRIPASMPYAYLFPALVQVTGPQHIIWNAFEASIKHLDGWDSYETFLRSLLKVFGDRSLLERFTSKCLVSNEEKQLFRNWPYRLVDWEWGYMTGMWQTVGGALDVIFLRFDSALMAGRGAMS